MQKHDHTPDAIVRRLSEGPRFSYLRDWVYGGIDGAVTTFAIVSGVVGAELSHRTILILGAANLIADGFSMAAGNFLATRSEHEELRQVEDYERRQVQHRPEGEREEVRQILKLKGFNGDLLERAVQLFTSDEERWVQLMLAEEYGLPRGVRSPFRAAVSTYSAFLVCGAAPLLTFAFQVNHAFPIACVLTCGVFFVIGSLKSKWSVKPWFLSGLETAGVGLLAAALSYGIGNLLA